MQPRFDRPRPELQVGERHKTLRVLSLTTGTQLHRGDVLDETGHHDRTPQQGGGYREVDLLLQHRQQRGHLFVLAVRVDEDHLGVLPQLARANAVTRVVSYSSCSKSKYGSPSSATPSNDSPLVPIVARAPPAQRGDPMPAGDDAERGQQLHRRLRRITRAEPPIEGLVQLRSDDDKGDLSRQFSTCRHHVTGQPGQREPANLQRPRALNTVEQTGQSRRGTSGPFWVSV